MGGCEATLEVCIRHAVFGVIYQVVTEQQPFPERAANLAEVDVVRTAGAERWHTLYQELTLCVWVVFPVDVPDALQRLHDCGPMLVSRANQDIDDRVMVSSARLLHRPFSSRVIIRYHLHSTWI